MCACQVDANAIVGVDVVSAGHVGGTRSSGIVSSAADVVVRLPRPMEGNGVTPIFRSLQN